MSNSVSPPDEGVPPQSYVLGHSDRELSRLAVQARLVNPITRGFFQSAGVIAGMRVLDVGSGAGDVAFLAAELVGETGEVVGVDRAPKALAVARERADALSLRNVSFREGDPGNMRFEKPFDAVIGRYVLMFHADPATMLREVAAHARPGGVVVFHEPDWDSVRSFPSVPTYDRCCRWIVETLRLSGANSRMGINLHGAYVEAGLAAPSMRLECVIGGGANSSDQVHFKTDLARTLGPEWSGWAWQRKKQSSRARSLNVFRRKWRPPSPSLSDVLRLVPGRASKRGRAQPGGQHGRRLGKHGASLDEGEGCSTIRRRSPSTIL